MLLSLVQFYYALFAYLNYFGEFCIIVYYKLFVYSLNIGKT